MAVISSQSVYIDAKQLLPLSYELNGYLTTRDQCIIGNNLISLNLDFLKYFCLAYKQNEEKLNITFLDKHYEGIMNGVKIDKINECIGIFEAYKITYEFIWENLKLIRITEHRRSALRNVMIALIAKIDDALQKWRSSVPKRYSIVLN